MTVRGEYAVVSDLKTYLTSNQTTDDALLLDMIRAASRDIDSLARGWFYPSIETRAYDVPGLPAGWTPLSFNSKFASRRDLVFDAPLLELTTLTNGDGTAVAGTQYILEPYNESPKDHLVLKRSSTVTWQPSTAGDAERVITVLGVWGRHPDYANAWVDTTTTLGANITSTTATTFTSSAGASLKAGWLIKIDSEYLYIRSIATNTVTVVRGVNGSTAATHTSGAAVTYWEVPHNVEYICRQAAAAYYRLKSSPQGETVIIDGTTIIQPQDVRNWIAKQLDREALSGVVTG